MALKRMRLGRKKERSGAARQTVMRFRPQGAPVEDIHPADNRGYVDVETDANGKIVTDSDVIPRP